jgi:virginiamycin B lyase
MVTTYVVPNTPMYLGSKIVSGPDGNLWFGQYFGPGIARIDTDGNIIVFPVTCGDVNGMTVGPDGDIWLTQPQCHSFGKITTAGVVTRYQLGQEYGPYGMVTSGGSVWFAASTTQIAQSTTDGAVTFYTISSTAVAPSQLASDDAGNIWFTEDQNNAIGMLATSGDVVTFPLPSGSRANSLTQGPDGAMWFTNPSLDQVGRITHDDAIEQFEVPVADALPGSLIVGPDKSLWFTAQGDHALGHITLSE